MGNGFDGLLIGQRRTGVSLGIAIQAEEYPWRSTVKFSVFALISTSQQTCKLLMNIPIFQMMK